MMSSASALRCFGRRMRRGNDMGCQQCGRLPGDLRCNYEDGCVNDEGYEPRNDWECVPSSDRVLSEKKKERLAAWEIDPGDDLDLGGDDKTIHA